MRLKEPSPRARRHPIGMFLWYMFWGLLLLVWSVLVFVNIATQ
jgi:hypothetical protein